MVGIVQLQHSPHALAHRQGFVVGGSDDRNLGSERRFQDGLALFMCEPGMVAAYREEAERHHEEINGVDGGHIEDDAMDRIVERAVEEKFPVHYIPTVAKRFNFTCSSASS